MDRNELMKELSIGDIDLFYTTVALAEQSGIFEECLSKGIDSFMSEVIHTLSNFYLTDDLKKMFYNKFVFGDVYIYHAKIRQMYRILKGVSQTELAEMAGVKQSHISAFESGKEYRRKVADAYNLIGYKEFEAKAVKG